MNEALHEHHLVPQSLDFPAAYASDVPTPATAKGANELDHSEIWWNSRACEFGDVLQANTFETA